MRRLVRRTSLSLPLLLLLASCSSGQPDPASKPPAPTASSTSATASVQPANPVLGSKEWYAWVDQSLGISDDDEHGPEPGSPRWNESVQRRLGQEAPQSQPGSPDWQQAVDALLRTRGGEAGAH
jgi:hypothetical protein